jgi:hypothetical protein
MRWFAHPSQITDMPAHDWTRVDAGIFHAFHHDWITEIARSLNGGLLPEDYYALPEQVAVGFGPDVLALQAQATDGSGNGDVTTLSGTAPSNSGGVLLAPAKLAPIAETDLAFYRRTKKGVAVRHVSGDRIVAFVEVVSPGNKSSRSAFRTFIHKAAELLENGIHLLIADLFPRGPRDPRGIHSAIWEEIAGQEQPPDPDKPLTLLAYEAALRVRAYVVPLGVGDTFTDMPLFVEPDQAVEVPLEATYTAAFEQMPRRWRRVLASV